MKKKISLIITEKKIIEKVCKKLKERVMKIIYYKKKKEMMPLSSKDVKSYEKQKDKKYVKYVKKGGFRDDEKNKKKVRDHCHHLEELFMSNAI